MIQNDFTALPDQLEVEKKLKRKNVPRLIANILYAVYGAFMAVILPASAFVFIVKLSYDPVTAFQTCLCMLILSHLVFWLCVYVPLNLISKCIFANALKREAFCAESTLEKSAGVAKNPSAYAYLLFARAVNRGGDSKARATAGEILQIVGITLLQSGALLLALPAASSQSAEAPLLIFIAAILLIQPCFIFAIKDKKLDQPNLRETLSNIKAEAQKNQAQ